MPALLYDALQLERFKKRSQLENYALMDHIAWRVLNDINASTIADPK